MDTKNNKSDNVVFEVGKTYTGQVKMYNSNKHFGFIYAFDDETNEKNEIFVHMSGINSNSVMCMLYAGEFVEFEVDDCEKGKQAINVRGIKGELLISDYNKKNFISQLIKDSVNPNLHHLIPNTNGGKGNGKSKSKSKIINLDD